MKILLRVIGIFILGILLFSCKKAPVDAPPVVTSITGKVADADSGTGIAGAQVTTTPATSSYVTASDGSYTISNLTTGQYTVTASKTGYNTNSTTVTVTEGQTTTADIALSRTSPELAVSVQTLDFGSVQSNNTFTISNQTGIGTVNWQLSYNQPWITISPASGSVTTNSTVINVSVKRDSLAYGNYSGIINVSSDHGSKQINVIMVKQNPNAPQLTVKPTTLDFGDSTNTLPVTIENTGTGTLHWNAGSNSSWLTVSLDSGTATSSSPAIINVSVNRSGLVPNTYQGDITVTTNGGTQSISVSMHVLSGTVAAPTLQVIGTPTTSAITVGWTKSTDATFQSYKLYRSQYPGVTEASTLDTTISTASVNNHTDSGLNSGTTYYYRVYAYGTNGVGSGSNEVNAATAVSLGTWSSMNSISIQSGSTVYANALSVLSDNDIWAAIGKEIWQFNGSNWSKNFTATNAPGNFSAIYMLNDNLGYAVTFYGGLSNGTYGQVYKYNGITWITDTSSVLSSSQANFHDVVALSSTNVWVAGEGDLYHFDGSTWGKVGLGTPVYDLDLKPNGQMFAIAYNGQAYSYSNGGWSLVATLKEGSTSSPLATISGINSADIWTTWNGSAWHIASGSIISVQEPSNYPTAQDIDMVSSNEGWLSYSDGVNDEGLYHYDGTNWTAVTNPTSSAIICIRMLSNIDGWALAANGALLHYTK